MCGIVGIIRRNPDVDPTPVAAMRRALRHRGPDSHGEYVSDHVALGATRLAIIDVQGGDQPLFNEDKNITLIANAEIYNFVELRLDMEAKGHRFKTASDCEVIVHLYEEYGEDFVDHLRGMFAVALWDEEKKKLVLARDRMGEKPLYVAELEDGLVFASEMKAILASGLVPFELDPDGVNYFFHFHYLPDPWTAVRGVRKLPGGHIRVIHADTWRSVESRYWRIEDIEPLEGDPVEHIREELETLASLVVRSDVPVGISLSGGMDSSLLAALAAKSYSGTLTAFCAGYSGRPPGDERIEARALADHLKIPFYDVEIEPAEVVDLFSDLTFQRDEPVADISGHGYFAIMRAAREKGIPVMLLGQGGDELFWGYPWVRAAAEATARKDRLLTGERGAVRDYWRLNGDGLFENLRALKRDRESNPERPVFLEQSLTFKAGAPFLERLFHPEFAERMSSTDPMNFFARPRPWPAPEIIATQAICETYLRENGLTQGDRLSMACSVEMRAPLVDFKLVETIVGLRKNRSDLRLPAKSWLKDAAAHLLPEWVLRRPKKGFSPPTPEWMAAIFQAHGGGLQDGYLVNQGVLTQAMANALSKGPDRNVPGVSMAYKALVLETWCRRMSRQATA